METIKWKIDVPILKNPLIVKQLMMAIGIPFGLLIAILSVLAIGANDRGDFKYAIGFILIIMFGTAIMLWITHRGKYSVEIKVDKKGVYSRAQKQQAKSNSFWQKVLIFAGIMARNPTAVGIGLLTQTDEKASISWRQIRKVKYYPKSRTIHVTGGFTNAVTIFCTEDNYEQISELVETSRRK